MIDTFALLLSHGLMMLVAWRLLWRDDLDNEPGEARKSRWGRKPDA